MSYDRAISARSDYVGALFDRGNTLQELQRFDDALASYDRVLALRPDAAEVFNNRGNALQALKRFDEALASYDRALALQPDYADAHVNKAICQLLLGDFARGWQEYEWRWQIEQTSKSRKSFARPRWTGKENISGQTILVHAEQGFGDTIQFSRYAPLLRDQGARVILQVQRPLRTLLGTLAGSPQVVGQGDPLPDFDLHCALLSLPLAFGTQVETIPSRTPYLSAAEGKICAWRERLGKRERCRVGLVWAGNPRKQLPGAYELDRQRSMPFAELAPILQVAGCEFYTLQKGGEAVAQLRQSALRHRVIDHSDALHDFSDTAALIENLDLVISVDTSVAHLAGALAKPFWLMNRFSGCWRWLLDRDDSPWCPTARLFHQDQDRTWKSVIERVHAALAEFAR